MPKANGSCLCGTVQYEISGTMRPVIYCHCKQCRKTSGHYVAATSCAATDLLLTSDNSLVWFRSSKVAQRGFCCRCGASMFWRRDNSSEVSIMAGTLDLPTGLTASEHIFVADSADYYSINDGLPQHADYGPAGTP